MTLAILVHNVTILVRIEDNKFYLFLFSFLILFSRLMSGVQYKVHIQNQPDVKAKLDIAYFQHNWFSGQSISNKFANSLFCYYFYFLFIYFEFILFLLTFEFLSFLFFSFYKQNINFKRLQFWTNLVDIFLVIFLFSFASYSIHLNICSYKVATAVCSHALYNKLLI